MCEIIELGWFISDDRKGVCLGRADNTPPRRMTAEQHSSLPLECKQAILDLGDRLKRAGIKWPSYNQCKMRRARAARYSREQIKSGAAAKA
jgi:hypothetical protein